LNRPLIVAIVGAVVVLIALGLTWLVGLRDTTPEDPPPPVAEAPPVSGEETVTEGVETPVLPQPQGSEDARSAEAGADPVAQPESPVEASPSFDVVRVDRDGNTVMAGRALPNAEVIIRDGAAELGRVTADERGEWVFLPPEPLDSGTRELRLGTVGADGTESQAEETVVMVVPETGNRDDDRPPMAVEVSPDRPSRVLQPPVPAVEGSGEGEPPAPGDDDAAPSVVIDVVDYDADGNLSVGGRAAPGASVLSYMDNTFMGRATAGEDGRWSVTAEDPVAVGRHTLRADVLEKGEEEVAARAEIPFLRPESIDTPGDGLRVVVQPGNSLWRIARGTLGAGTAYTVIYEANRAQIRNPDLIYPGQVFVIPGEEGRVLER
jgi:nucleoid-associated protein YgaU